MEEEKIVKCEISLGHIFFPKFVKRVESGEYAIFTSKITKEIENCEDIGNDIKLKGNVCMLEYGTTYKVFCKLADQHEKYGNTYEIVFISKCIDISSAEKQREFLRNIINENLVDKLFEKYDNVLSLLENRDVKSLMKIRGIGNRVALRIIDEYEESKDYSSIYIELGRLGLTHTLIKKLVDFYGSPDVVVDTVKNKPYELVKVDGIGFKKADEIACKVGVGQFDIQRIKGFLVYHLIEMGETGKSYVFYQDLLQQLYDTLGYVPEDVINNVAKLMIANKDVVVLDNGNRIALSRYYNLEKNIMKELLRLANPLEYAMDEIDDEDLAEEVEIPYYNENKSYTPKEFAVDDWRDLINKVEIQQGYDYTDEQLGAIELSIDSFVMALTGLGGSGKTSTANGICSLYSRYNITACALSGKAAVRITEATGLPAMTIHRALGYSNGMFTYNKHNKIPTDIILIDEATMINGSLFLSLLQACPSGAKVIIMGDVQQLTPIGNCQVFSDILESNVLPVVKLTKPHRQALMSGIIPTSIKVANQELIFDNRFEGNEIVGELHDMEFEIYQDTCDLTSSVVDHFQKELAKYNDILEVQVCVAMRLRGNLSCYSLNNKLQTIYNSKFLESNEIEITLSKKDKDEETKKYIIRKGDKVLNTKNNYNSINTDGDKCPVFNGNIGLVEGITDEGYCTINFIGIGRVVFKKAECKNLELAYACTVHKMQGSGFTSTIVVIDNTSYIMNNSELLYTAITRAKKYCVLIGNNAAIRAAIQKKEVKTKQTFLKDFLMESGKGVA